MQVSVIVLTYNPDLQKLCNTLNAVINQKGVDFELIIADDGSRNPQLAAAEGYLQEQGFTNYRLVANAQNKGTVQNCISGLAVATGQYVFFTSPGDILFDERVLADFFAFAQQQNTPLCFGNAVHYDCPNGKPVLTSDYTTPANPDVFNPNRSLSFRKSCYCNRSWITGAVFFRERILAQKYFNAIAATSVYTEDTPSTLFAMAEQTVPAYYNRNMVWYESGGVSTGGNSKWTALIDRDICLSVRALKAQYPHDPFVDVAYINATVQNRYGRILRKLICHPAVMFYSYLAKLTVPAMPLVCEAPDLQRLQQLLSHKSD